MESVGGSVGTFAGPDLRRGSPPGPGRERGGVLRTLRVVGAFPVPRGAAPRCPACPAGVPISPEKWGERGPGLRPWTPGFYGRSLPLAGFWDRCLWYGRGAISSGMLRPIWDAFFEKICRKAFLRKTVPKSGHVHGHRNSPSTGTMWHNRQNERVQHERAIREGGPGGIPLGFFLPISSQEMGAPARGRAGNHLAGSNLRRSKPGPPTVPAETALPTEAAAAAAPAPGGASSPPAG